METNFCIVVRYRLYRSMVSGLLMFVWMTANLPTAHGQVSLGSELKKLHDLSLLPRYEAQVVNGQVSSYDTTGGNDDGFSGTYSYIRRLPDSSLVLFDIQGAGVINRIWTPTPGIDTLDFYVDDDERRSFSIAYLDLFSGNTFPFTAPLCGNQLGGYYCYLPIPFAKSCKIIYRGKKTQFHQIQYKLFKGNSEVVPFSFQLSATESALLKEIHDRWTVRPYSITHFYSTPMRTSKTRISLEPGQQKQLFQLLQGGRITGIECSPPKVLESLIKNIDIKITWDHETTPAVYCPLSDFMGYAFGKQRMQSILMGADETKAYTYLPMPFDQKATIDIVYRPDEQLKLSPIQLDFTIYYTLQKRKASEEGKLYTQWMSQPQSTTGVAHEFLKHTGKGHVVGTLLHAQGLKPGMTYFFEGDDRTVIDGQLRLHGTGSEDYFNGGWYAMMDRWDKGMSLPIHGALDYSLLYGRTGGYRWYLSDKLNFTNSIHHSIEHGPEGNLFPVQYTSLCYFYSDQAPTHYIKPHNALTKVLIPDTMYIYPQLAEYSNFGAFTVETSWKYGTGGESYRFITDKESWLRIALNDVPDGLYHLVLDVQKEHSGTWFSIWQRQSPISAWIDSHSEQEKRVEALWLGKISTSRDNNSITIRFKPGGLPKSLLIHRIKLIKIQP